MSTEPINRSRLYYPFCDLPEITCSCLHSISRRIRSLWGNHSLHKPLLSEDLSTNESEKRPFYKKVISSAQSLLGHSLTRKVFIIANCAGITTSAVLLAPVLEEYANNCLDELNSFTGNLAACRQPYQSRLIRYKVIIGVSSGLLGFIFQKFLEKPSIPSTSQNKCISKQRLRGFFLAIQNKFSYEIQLGIGYLYNGLWINTSTISSWNIYLNCETAGISLAAALLGMYLRIQYTAIKNLWENRQPSTPDILSHSFRLSNHCGMIVVALLGASAIGVTSSAIAPFSSKKNRIITELGGLILGRPIGRLIAYIIREQSKSKRPYVSRLFSIISACTSRLPASLVGMGYYIYLLNRPGSKIAGMCIIGCAEGIKDIYYIPPQEKTSDDKALNPSHNSRLLKAVFIIRNYWKTSALVGFVIALKVTDFLRCYDVSIFDCPISFELSGNYVNIDGNGLSISIISGLATFHLRRLSRILQYHTKGFPKQLSRKSLQLADKYHFDSIALIPYSIINAGSYLKDYNAYATYNPIVLLLLLGFTFGSYKEKIGFHDPFRPIFTDMAVLI